ncbi:hypothetical protein RUM44_003534 [Polyplax serrata]|uniref:Uncharacterized protein n=1 Tax=Polyplax serrata TaxID=468196 RepID=A0ABR1AGR1_POLSC
MSTWDEPPCKTAIVQFKRKLNGNIDSVGSEVTRKQKERNRKFRSLGRPSFGRTPQHTYKKLGTASENASSPLEDCKSLKNADVNVAMLVRKKKEKKKLEVGYSSYVNIRLLNIV